MPQAMALAAMPPARTSGSPRIVLKSASGATVSFMLPNGEPTDGASRETRILPRLVLRRNGALTSAGERTLILELSDLEVSPPGLTITLQLETFHGDPDPGGSAGSRIVVWHDSAWISPAAGAGREVTAVQFRHVFEEELLPGVATPTDYLRLAVAIHDPAWSTAQPLYVLQEDNALLLENEWLVKLPHVLEEGDGAAPDEILVYYCDMFPARRAGPGSAPWLPRAEVSAFVGGEFVPAALDAFRLQSNVWRFPWYLAWTPHSPTGNPAQLAVALSPTDTWFHGPSPDNGHAGIAINLDAAGTDYDTLLDGMMSTFHHELFHNLQRGLYQHFGLDREGDWDVVTEGMAMLASSVAQPDVQFQSQRRRAYLSTASAFVGEEGTTKGDLNASYADIAYDGAAYWRFLYEQCAVGDDGAEDPAAGMGVERRVLAALYATEARSHLSRAKFVQAFPGIMDQSLAGSPCPFQTYEDSLVAFARAVYALRLVGGRCSEVGLPAGCGLYDPHGLYPRPPADAIHYASRRAVSGRMGLNHSGAIGSSYGIDLVEVILDPADRGRPLTIELRASAEGAARFHLEVWGVSKEGRPIRAATASPDRREHGRGRTISYTVPAIGAGRYDRLGVIIVRVDNREERDPEGSYTLRLYQAE